MLSLAKVQQILHDLQDIGTPFQAQKSPTVHLLAAGTEPWTQPIPQHRCQQLTIFWWPCWAALDAWSNMQLSAWLQGDNEARSGSSRGLLKTSSALVITSCLPSMSNLWMKASERNQNNCVLLASMQRKLCLFPGMSASATTRLNTPLPHFSLALLLSESAR